MAKRNLPFLFLCLFFLGAEAKSTYADKVKLGQFSSPDFASKNDNAHYFSDNTGKVYFLEDDLREKYFDQSTSDEVLGLYRFWSQDLPAKSQCSNAFLEENLDYIQYLYRLVSISYLYEMNKRMSMTMSRLFGAPQKCQMNYSILFSACRPKYGEMGKFVKRVEGVVTEDLKKISTDKFLQSEIDRWTKDFGKVSSLSNDVVYAELFDWCSRNKKNCRQLQLGDISMALNEACQENINDIQLICNENDHLFGLSNVEQISHLIGVSHTFNLINKNGYGAQCLDRFVKLFATREHQIKRMPRVFSSIYTALEKENARYKQGELFIAGALKEFDDLGLKDFLVILAPPKPTPTPIVKKNPVVVAKKVEPPKVVVIPTPEPVVVTKVEPVPPPPVVPKKSAFEQAVQNLTEHKADKVELNMEAFKQDFIFTSDYIAKLSGPIQRFKSIQGLKDMKQLDLLGQKEAPLGIKFLKFLIDLEDHQGLYNVVTVLGNKFWVYNDIEEIDRPVFIELKNDQSTNLAWKIWLLKL